eukprot:3810230-Rhodomonas_salina.1
MRVPPPPQAVLRTHTKKKKREGLGDWLRVRGEVVEEEGESSGGGLRSSLTPPNQMQETAAAFTGMQQALSHARPASLPPSFLSLSLPPSRPPSLLSPSGLNCAPLFRTALNFLQARSQLFRTALKLLQVPTISHCPETPSGQLHAISRCPGNLSGQVQNAAFVPLSRCLHTALKARALSSLLPPSSSCSSPPH